MHSTQRYDSPCPLMLVVHFLQFVAIHEAVDKFQHFLCFLVTSKEDHRSQMSILRENLRDIQLATERRAIILAGVNAITADVNSLSIEVTSLNDIFNLVSLFLYLIGSVDLLIVVLSPGS